MHVNIAMEKYVYLTCYIKSPKIRLLHVFPISFAGNPRSIPAKSNITMEIRVWIFQNYRDCEYTHNPHKFEIPAL